MKKFLLIATLLTLSGCSYFTEEPESLTSPIESQQTTEEVATSTESTTDTIESEMAESSESFSDNDTFDNVFDESVIGQDRYPNTMLPNNIPIGELRTAIDEYYSTTLAEDEKALNYDRVDAGTLETLQTYYSENEVFEPLDITVDQIEMELGGQANFVTRIVIGMPYEEAEALVEDNDILVLNEAMAQLENRLVLLAYYDEESETLTPYHLTNSTSALFSLREKDDNASSQSSTESVTDSSSEEE